MRLLDWLCAGGLFILALIDSWLVPRTYTGRIWIFGTCVALLFAAMLNLLRIKNGYKVRWLRIFCVAANVALLAFTISLMASIGRARTMLHPQIAAASVMLLMETVFSLGKNE